MNTGSERSAAWRQRKREAGYVFVNGRAVYRPVRLWVQGLRPHGTEGRYCQRCRCDLCRAAHAAAKREQRARARR